MEGGTMALRGDTRAVGLADIFQALALSRREGTLSVSSGGKDIKVYFSADGIRLLSTGALRHTRLGSILLEKDDFPPGDLEFALQIQKSTGKKLGEVLVEYGLLKQEEIDECLRRQIEEEICEIFLWNNAEFTFEPGITSEKSFDPTGQGRIFDIDVSRILLEAARNVDEWSLLLARIQNTNSRFIYKNGFPVMPDTSPFGVSIITVSRLPYVLKDARTLAEIAEELEVGHDTAAKLIAFLIRKGRVLEIAGQPTLKRVIVTPKESRHSHTWRRSHSWNIDDMDCRSKLDKILLNAQTPEDAASHMSQLADSVREEGDAGTATRILKVALELVPHDNGLRKKAIQAYVSQWKFDEAAKLVVQGCKLQHTTAS
jgi:hypothetical protein